MVGFFVAALPGSEMERIEEHLASCSACARLVAEAARETGSQKGTWSDRLRPGVVTPGTVVAGRYLIRRSLGRGAMGEVHEAEDRLLDKVVALKTLNARLTGWPGAIDRLKSEVAMAHRVTHPNVNRVFDLGVDHQAATEGQEAFVFLTMEYLAGETASTFLRRRGPLPPIEALPLLSQIAAGLAAAHDVGVVHRDLKAENVMLVGQPDGNLRAVITDFGLAGSIISDLSAPDVRWFSGTLAYAAPERLAGHRATPASDVYSFGLLAHHMLTGALPATASAAVVAAAIRLGERLGSASLDEPALGPAWDRFVMRTLHPTPSERYSNGAELREGLRSLPDTARASVAPRRALRWGAAAAAVLVGAIWVTTRSRTRSHWPASWADSPSVLESPRTLGPPATIEIPSPRVAARVPVREPERPVLGSKVTRAGARQRARQPGSVIAHDVPVPSIQPKAQEQDHGGVDIVRELRDDRIGSRSGDGLGSDLADPFTSWSKAKRELGR